MSKDEFPRFFLEICRHFEGDDAFDLVLENLHNAVEVRRGEEEEVYSYCVLLCAVVCCVLCVLLKYCTMC